MATTECRELPHLSLDLKDGNYDDVYKLLQEIKPMWVKEKIHVKVLSGGYSCHMLRCSEDSGESVTVRVANNFADKTNPANEIQTVKVMSSKGYFPPIRAAFQNGFCYEYIPGKPIYMKDATEICVDDDQLKIIAEMLANIHSVCVPGQDYQRTTYFDFITSIISGDKPSVEGYPSSEELRQEIRFVEEYVSTVHSPLVQMHGDAHPGNIVWNEKQKKVTFVDWETTQVGPRALDIAYFFKSFETTSQFVAKDIAVMTPINFERKFCEHYLKQWNDLRNKPYPTETEIEQLLLEVKYLTLAPTLTWMVFAVGFGDVASIMPNAESFKQYSFSSYLKIKEGLTGMKTIGFPSK